MNTLDLQALSLEEMNDVEMRDVEGGFGIFAPLLALFVGYLVGVLVEAAN